MSNPMANIIPVEEREDGVYVKVTRDQRKKIDIVQIDKALKAANVINYDLSHIKEVVERARGGFERVSPPFEYYNPQIENYIEVTINPLSASMRVDAEIDKKSVDLTISGILCCLRRRGIRFGVKNDVLDEFIKNPVYGKDIEIAEGRNPQPGVNGKIEYEVEIDPDVRPQRSHGGKVNYREIQTFAAVKDGDIIARRIPPGAGKAGMTVMGEQIDAPGGNDVALPQGKNTMISEDGTSLIACKTGIVYREGGVVHVEELLKVNGDVDYSVGNIKYTGNVLVEGSVMPGFSIETEGDIHIAGEVESARIISRNGVVTIESGVIGKEDTYVYGKNGVCIEFAQEANLKTDGILTVQKYILHCDCMCESFETTTHNGSVVGGSLKAFKTIKAGTISNATCIPTKVCIVNKIKIAAEKKIAELQSLKEKLQEQMTPVSRDLKAKTAILRKAGSAVTGKHRDEMKKVIEKYNDFSRKIKYIDKKTDEIKSLLEKPSTYDGYVKVYGTAYPGAEINLYEKGHRSIKQPVTNKVFKLHDGALQTEENDGV